MIIYNNIILQYGFNLNIVNYTYLELKQGRGSLSLMIER